MVEIRQCISKRELNENCIILQISVVFMLSSRLPTIFIYTSIIAWWKVYLYLYYSMVERCIYVIGSKWPLPVTHVLPLDGKWKAQVPTYNVTDSPITLH